MTATIENDTKSHSSYKSTPSSRSSVLERAHKLTRKMEGLTPTTTTSSRGPTTPASRQSQSTRPSRRNEQPMEDQPQEAVVPPELLVDALSGHEDGLLAIAERLMEHYDSGYDAMGEAIIDAFADVQKLFQHVVEAAHMEGAAFEASRREEEIQELRRQAAKANGGIDTVPSVDEDNLSSPAGPVRHDEFIDQDVKDCLNEAIKQGAALKDANKHLECFELYERACQSASALLPVDSDHRGRLQLSIARADSMSPDRGCAILRYAMDDVLRSGLRAGKTHLPDPSKRADVVLQKPKAVVQSSQEQMNSLVEEMKEILEAPVYKDTPLQDVAKRFWVALQETQKQQNRNEERLEQNLGKLKGDFLLARAEWEEKISRAEKEKEDFRTKYMSLSDGSNAASYMDAARNVSQQMGGTPGDESSGIHSFQSSLPRGRGSESMASFHSMAQHARTLVSQFNCASLNDRMGPILNPDAEGREEQTERYGQAEWRDRRPNDAAKAAFAGGARQTRIVDV